MGEELEISAELALETVQRLRKRGGFGRLVGTAFALPGTIVFGISTIIAATQGALSSTALLVAITAGCAAITVRNIRQNSFVDQREARAIRRLEGPLSAVLSGQCLLVGTTTKPRAMWRAVSLAPHEVQELRTLALPAARVHDDGS